MVIVHLLMQVFNYYSTAFFKICIWCFDAAGW